MDFELFGIQFNLVTTISCIIIGFLLCTFTLCSCTNMEKLYKTDFQTEWNKVMNTIKSL